MSDDIDYHFREVSTPFVSASQTARVWTEEWVLREMFCPACGASALRDLPNNSPVADFDCEECAEQFELKSTKGGFGRKVVDGAYETMIARLNIKTAPNLMLLRYDKTAATVIDVEAVPNHFFVPHIIERRKPLAETARRAGWVGCNIRLDRIPAVGRIGVIKGQVARPVSEVTRAWANTEFLRKRTTEARGWLLEVLNCVEQIGSSDFSLASVYSFEDDLAKIYPENQNIRPKIRQQLQVLRDARVIVFLGNGKYRLR